MARVLVAQPLIGPGTHYCMLHDAWIPKLGIPSILPYYSPFAATDRTRNGGEIGMSPKKLANIIKRRYTTSLDRSFNLSILSANYDEMPLLRGNIGAFFGWWAYLE